MLDIFDAYTAATGDNDPLDPLEVAILNAARKVEALSMKPMSLRARRALAEQCRRLASLCEDGLGA